jgi:glycosyltransferase involved in cell wall biosynthesis
MIRRRVATGPSRLARRDHLVYTAARTMRPIVLLDATPLSAPSGTRGIGRYIFDLLRGLEECKASWEGELDLMALGSFDAGPSRDLATVAAETIKNRGTSGERLIRMRRMWLPAVARRANAALVHITEALGTPPVLPAPRLVTCYDLIPLRYPREYLGSRRAKFERLLVDAFRYRSAVRVVAISEKTKQELVEILHMKPDVIDVATCGIDSQHWTSQDAKERDPARRAALGLGDKPYVVYVGFSDYRKNVEGMLAALSHARRQVDVELAWAGSLPPRNLASVQRKARDAGVFPHVRMLGFIGDPDLAALYRGAAAHVFLSRIEGFGLSVAEAMAAGCPVIVGGGSGTDEVAGDAGIVVDPDDPISAGDAIVRLIRDPAERERRARAGRERALLYDRRNMALQYVDSYRAALGLARGAS